MNSGIRAVIAVGIIAGGVGMAWYLVSTKPKPKKSALVAKGTVVEVIAAQEHSSMITVHARGTVMPARQVVLGTEVGGKVINVAENLQPGGTFSKGDIIARVDPSDYRLAVQQQFALVDSAAAQLQVEESRVAVAKREWEMFGSKGKGAANKQLALRQPQMRSATTQLKSAKSGLRRARLSVERTLLRAPFDGMVQERSVDLGQIVAPGAPLLRFVGTRSYWVQVSIPVERLLWISVPGMNTKGPGSKVVVSHKIGNQRIEKDGRILRLLADVDPAGHMARILIEVDDPLGLAPQESTEPPVQPESLAQSSKLPLLLGSYVEVAIEGREAKGVVELDRAALRSGNEVFLFTSSSTLERRKVDVLWRQEGSVLLSGGLKAGELIVMSPLATAVEGMKLRLPGQDTNNRSTKNTKNTSSDGGAGEKKKSAGEKRKGAGEKKKRTPTKAAEAAATPTTGAATKKSVGATL